MENIVLQAEMRDVAVKNSVLRGQSRVLAVVYGRGIDSMALDLDYESVRKAYINVGETSVVNLELKGKTIPVLFKEVQLHPVSDKILHVDFYAVDLKQEVVTHVPLILVGLAPAVKILGGNLSQHLDEVEVKCLPNSIPKEIEVDVTGIEDFHTTIHVSDLILPEGVVVMNDPEEAVANVVPSRDHSAEADQAAQASTEGAEEEAPKAE